MISTKAVIPAVGFGTRMLPATKPTPKELLTVVDKPSIQYVVEYRGDCGCERGAYRHGPWQGEHGGPLAVYLSLSRF